MMPSLAVPFDIDPTGRVAAAYDDMTSAAQHLKLLITTRVGERVMRPTYGTRIFDTLFDIMDELVLQELDSGIRRAVSIWAPDIVLTRLEMSAEESTLVIDIAYTLRDVDGVPPQTLRVNISSTGQVTETLL